MKKIIIAVSVVLVLTFVGCAGMIFYHNEYYDSGVSVSYPIYGDPSANPESDIPAMKRFRKEGKSYFCSLGIWFSEKSSKKQQANMKLVSDNEREFVEETLMKLEKPHYIEAKYENVDGQTVITYRGEITNPQTGELEPYEKVFRYPFIVTKNIQNLNPQETNYFNDN